MAKLAVIGSGVVGQATGKGFFRQGHEVVFFDVNQKTLDVLTGQGFRAYEPEFLAREDGFDAFFLSVNTPTVEGRICLDYIQSAAVGLAQTALRRNKKWPVVTVRSTLPPGTTESVVIPLLEKYSGKNAGSEFGVCFNPEYLREKSNEDDFAKPWIVTIGELNKRSGQSLLDIYGDVPCPVMRLSIKEAEIQKYIHNLFNACKISFFNEMRMVCERLGLDSDNLFELVSLSAEASWNRKYGIKNLGPFSGSCLPKDTQAFLGWVGDCLGCDLPLLRAVIEVNEAVKKKSGLVLKEEAACV